ncbi:MAG: hypothetical protein JWR87_2501 [Segetibacter sp.]|nr:hypothetical protein [Segetibacter sp.]
MNSGCHPEFFYFPPHLKGIQTMAWLVANALVRNFFVALLVLWVAAV